MVDISGATEQIVTKDDLGEGEPAEVDYWLTQEKIAEKEERLWVRKARLIVRRYRDERATMDATLNRFNIFWSNVQTLQPALYGRTPKPDVERRFKDSDPVGRTAAIILERAISYSLEAYDFDDVMRNVVQDRLIPGRGVARIMYIPTYGQPIVPTEGNQAEAGVSAPSVVANEGDEGIEGAEEEAREIPKAQVATETEREVVYEEARCKYVFWEDYREGPARVWEEVPWLRYRAYMTRAELVTRFGKEKGSKVKLDYTPKGGDKEDLRDGTPDIYKKAIVHEVWDKSTRKVIWYAPGTPEIVLDKQDDPLKLPGFFPGPNPLLATTTTDKRIPVPDYHEYQDQAREMDELTTRIGILERALKVSGVYAGEQKQALQSLLDTGTENKLVPVEDWAMFAEKGGLQGMILWFPIEQVAGVLIQLYNARDRAKQVLYEITGIADVVRGASNPSETATAQQIKSQYANLRLSHSQKAVALFARDLIRLTAAVIAEHFSPQTISMITGYPQLEKVPPPPQPPQMQAAVQVDPQTGQSIPDPVMAKYQQQLQTYIQQVAPIVAENQQKQVQFDEAIKLLREDARHDFRIDIEADSTIAIDEQEDKQARVEFMQQFVPLFEQLAPMVQGNPAMAALAKEVMLFAVRGFRVARTLEEVIEKAFDQLAKMPPKPPEGAGKGESPQQIQADTQTKMADIQSRTQVDMQANAIKQQEVQGNLALTAEKNRADTALRAGKLQIDQERLESDKQQRALEAFRTQVEAAGALV